MSTTLPILLGVDIGTTRVKAVAVGLEGTELAHASQATPWVRRGLHVEMDPEELAHVIRAILSEVCAACAERSAVRALGIGFAGMGEAGVLVDGAGAPLNRIVAWHDPRGDVETIQREIGVETFERTVGMPLNAQPSLAKILWLRRTHPELARAAGFLSVPEWAVASLGGARVSELSLASRTGLLDLAEAAPSAGAAELLGRSLLSEIVVAGTPAGNAGHEALPTSARGAVLTVAGHDHQVAALAAGASRPNVLFNSLGSAESLARCVAGGLDPAIVGRLAGQGLTVGWGVVDGRSAVLGGLRTGLVLEDVARLLGVNDPGSRRRLGEQALLVDPRDAPEDLLSPAGDTARVPGLLAEGVSPAAVWAAAVRDLTAASVALLARIAAEVGPHERVVVGGGWARDPGLLAEKRRRLGELTASTLREPGAMGAALLAGVAADVLARPESDPSPIWSVRTHVPQEGEAASCRSTGPRARIPTVP
jgi:sugar (pentulose or hexulose) kinase